MQQEQIRLILVDFETHSQKARKGGTHDKNELRGERATNDEAIPLKLLQQICQKLGDMNSDGGVDRNKRFWGFPINTTFKDLKSLWYAVRDTRIHLVNRHDIEFSLAVHIVPYPCGVLSVWIYVAAFVDRTTENL